MANLLSICHWSFVIGHLELANPEALELRSLRGKRRSGVRQAGDFPEAGLFRRNHSDHHLRGVTVNQELTISGHRVLRRTKLGNSGGVGLKLVYGGYVRNSGFSLP